VITPRRVCLDRRCSWYPWGKEIRFGWRLEWLFRCGDAGVRRTGSLAHVARDLGINSEVLRKQVRQAEADQGLRPDLAPSEELEEIKRLRQENFGLRRANEILKSASVFSPRNSTQTDRSEPLRRRAPRALRGRVRR
jgi:transposase